jgi:hypothetical protein
VFGLCAIGVAALGWYIGQIAPQVSGATRTSVAELPTGTPVHAPVDARGAATKAAHPVSRSATGAHGLSDAGAPHGSDTGTLVVKSEPAGARISIDGRASGVTPATFRRVAPGEHRISLTHGAIVINQVARVESAGTVTVVASLRAPSTGFGWIAASAPVELDVAENGELLGTTRSRRIMLPEGPHTLEVSNAALGYRDTAQVRIVAGEVIPLRISLPTSVVHVNAIPWAEVWIDGKPIGQTPIGNVPTELGSHAVLFRHPELGERTVTVMVKNGVPTRVTADLRVR